jgi:hypothetical protein
MALTNAQRQARWRERRAAELRALLRRVPGEASQDLQVPAEASIGHLIEALIKALRDRSPAERAKAIVHLARRLGIEVEEAADSADSEDLEEES